MAAKNRMPLSKAYWSDDIVIDPNIFFGTTQSKPSNSQWARVRTPSGDYESPTQARNSLDGERKGPSRQNSIKSKWNKGVQRLGSVSNFYPNLQNRRGTLLVETVAETARLSRQNSFDSPPPTTAKRRFSSLARAGQTLRQLIANRTDADSEENIDAVDKFKVMVRKIQVERKISNDNLNNVGQIVTDLGGKHRRAVSFGDVTMGALYKNVDKRKLAKLHKMGQEYNRKRRLLQKFKRAVRLTVFCRRQVRAHSFKKEEESEFSRVITSHLQKDFEQVDLLFDPTKYKANKQSRITDEFIRIMSKQAQDRTEQEIYYAQIALRNIQCFEDFPARMQRRIAECALFESYEAQRVLVRQGHPASSYYFILSGAVSVMVVDEGESFAKPVAYLSKGQTFGELAIINRSKRQSSIIAREESQFLTISVDDYHNIFMAGGVKTMNDPDHDDFIQSLTFLKGWPLHLLKEKSNKCLFLYFKRGDVLVKDSQYSDWLIVVKSGSVAVLKRLRKVAAYESRNTSKDVKVITERSKREKQLQKTLWRKNILPELHVPLQGLDEEAVNEEYNKYFDDNGDPIPFTHPDYVPEFSEDANLGSRKVWNFGSKNKKNGPRVKKVSHVQLPQIVMSNNPQKLVQKITLSEEQIAAVQAAQPKQSIGSVDDITVSKKRSPARLPVTEEESSDAAFKSQIRTINTDLDSGFARKDPDEITAADLNPEFVHIQTLTKGRVFGLSDIVLGPQTSVCVVSNGADCLLISKQLFKEHMPDALFRQLRMDLCPYPTEEELQSSLQTSVDWKAFKGQTLAQTLKFVKTRRDLVQHLKA